MEHNKSIFAQNEIDLEHKLFIRIWKNEQETMTDEDFKEAMKEQAELVTHYQLDKILIDAREMNYTVAPKIQDWTNTEIVPLIAPFSKKLAIVMPTDLFEQVSFEQSMDDAKEVSPIDDKYFNNFGEAKKWILSKI